jgi:CRISPR-associated endonuclease/helicase Cas3
MMVTFVSQCEKKALKKTRRILDAFANRIGDNTWQTLITEEGLYTVHKMLRQTASRNTAVSCHWIRSRSRSQLLWIVGNKRKFNHEGIVPVNRTEKDLPSSDETDNWHYLPLIKTLTALAALLHDWGKATQLFQDKLDPNSINKYRGDPLRHEWISSLLFVALVRSNQVANHDENWLTVLIEQNMDENELQQKLSSQAHLYTQDGYVTPFDNLPDAASLILWLVLSHHRLPKAHDKNNFAGRSNDSPQRLLKRISEQWGYSNRFDEIEFKKRLPDCFSFPCGLLSQSSIWRIELSNRARQLKEQLSFFTATIEDGSWRVIAHHARLCLMLGDHLYSSQDKDISWKSPIELYANTGRDEYQQLQLKQKLDEHLVKVAETAVKLCRYLPTFESKPPAVQNVVQLQPQNNLSPELKRKFGWQDKAVYAIQNYRKETEDQVHAYFVVNMASTGRGKTLANAKIMQSLSEDQQSLRFILALGLRTLTLQTGDEYRNRIGLGDDELAVLIGSKAVMELHQGSNEIREKEESLSDSEKLGSESVQPLLEPEEQIHWDDDDEYWQNLLPEDYLKTVLKGKKERALLYAPVLACTIDHIMGATETIRGGRYILPSLRLMSSDLVIDEIDDFTGEDLVAIGRLIFLAGMLGRRLMISSATIPPDLALGYFVAYQRGWKLFASSRKKNSQVACGWTDEFRTELITISQGEHSASAYQESHQNFITKRVSKLRKEVVRRRARIGNLPIKRDDDSFEINFFATIQKNILEQHRHHHEQDKETECLVSFGVVRCANITPCIELTKYLLESDWPEDTAVRVMAYHSQQVLLLRHEQEQHLDQVLKRKVSVHDPKDGVFSHSLIRHHLDSIECSNLIFILVATPVEEVGRDHDFDWAIVEPSSYRSIIQLAGRVRRHRDEPKSDSPNMVLLQYNLKGYKGKTKNVFSRPGYEQGNWQLSPSKSLTDILDFESLLQRVDAIPRIRRETNSRPSKKLAALEHFVIGRTLGCQFLIAESNKKGEARGPEIFWGYIDDFWWMTALPQQFNRFRNGSLGLSLYLIIDERKGAVFKIYDKNSGWVVIEKTLGIEHQPLIQKYHSRLWLLRDYESIIVKQSKIRNETLEQTSQFLGELNLSFHSDNNCYSYNDQLGLVKIDQSK